ncbi:MAG: hypothetical protein QXY40_09625 [Candidatus Methanomethylicia archaeon]
MNITVGDVCGSRAFPIFVEEIVKHRRVLEAVIDGLYNSHRAYRILKYSY